MQYVVSRLELVVNSTNIIKHQPEFEKLILYVRLRGPVTTKTRILFYVKNKTLIRENRFSLLTDQRDEASANI